MHAHTLAHTHAHIHTHTHKTGAGHVIITIPVFRDKLLNIVIDSHLGKLPNFLEGRISSDNSDFHVGSYIQTGSHVETTVVSGESVRIHPIKPAGVRITKAGELKIQFNPSLM